MKMQLGFAGLASGLFLSAAALAGPTNLLTNGSFESPAIAAGTFQQLSSIPGWTGTAGVEVQSNNLLGAGNGTPFGNQYLELNVEGPSTLSQTISTTPGGKYLLSFYFADRPGTGPNSVSVDFTGNASKTYTLPDNGSVVFKQFTETLTATGTQSVLSFTPSAASLQGEGSLLDNVAVTGGSTASVPTPNAFWIGLAGLLGLGALQFVRRAVAIQSLKA